MRGDLHHLFACESKCNSFRGNTAYAEFEDFPEERASTGIDIKEVVRDDCCKTALDGFEPRHGKGAATRAVYYILMRYPGVISTDRMPSKRLVTVRTWHEQEPVSLWKRHRNAAIFDRQEKPEPVHRPPRMGR